MASNSSTIEYDFVETPSNDFFCPVTLEILKDPQQTSSCCGHHLSREAAERLKRERMPCPICKCKPLKTTNDLFFKNKVMALKVRCSKKALGCTWVGGLGQLEEHMMIGSLKGECGYVDVACPYNCFEYVQRRGLVKHTSAECWNRPFTCEFCGYNATFEVIVYDHWPQCQRYPEKCPNKCCEEDIEHHFLKRHLDQECPLQEIECEFSYAGCRAKMQRRIMQEHMEKNEGKHLDAVSTHVKVMTTQLQRKLHALCAKIETPIFVLPPDVVLKNFEKRKQDNNVWYSPSFYTHISGYKMCMRIHANGWRDTQNTHVSVFVCMMRGEFDDHLQWPFKGVVTIRLVNQKEGGVHVEKNVVDENDNTENNLGRVLQGDIFTEGWGQAKFIRHSDLYKPKRGLEYLINDTLRFQVTTVIVKSVQMVTFSST